MDRSRLVQNGVCSKYLEDVEEYRSATSSCWCICVSWTTVITADRLLLVHQVFNRRRSFLVISSVLKISTTESSRLRAGRFQSTYRKLHLRETRKLKVYLCLLIFVFLNDNFSFSWNFSSTRFCHNFFIFTSIYMRCWKPLGLGVNVTLSTG